MINPPSNVNPAPPAPSAKAHDAARNFWEVGAYRDVVSRVEGGIGQVDDVAKMLGERGAIEAKYAAMLRQWSERWEGKMDRAANGTAGSVKGSLQGLLAEAEATAQVHLQSEARLAAVYGSQIPAWKKEQYPKTKVMKQYKAIKRAEDGFAKAQAPWAKLMDKVERGHKAHAGAVKAHEAADRRARDAALATNVTQDERRKLQDKVARALVEVDQAKAKCSARLDALAADAARYRAEMTAVFDDCQDLEQRRIEFFKGAIGTFVQGLVAPGGAEGYGPGDRVHDAVQAINADADLLAYAATRGTGMPFEPPRALDAEAHTDADRGWAPSPVDLEPPPAGESCAEESVWGPSEPGDAAVDAQEKMVRAIYDYAGEDAEELSFKIGDLLTQLEDADDQGWCKGRDATGNVGFFPAYYVKQSENSGEGAESEEC